MNASESMKAAMLEKISELLPSLTTGNLRTISAAMDMAMLGYTISKECTDLVVYVNDIPPEVKEYLVAKRIEGKSDLTLRNTSYIFKGLFRTLRKPVNQITTNDVRAYLYQYSQDHGVSDRTLDHMRIVFLSFWTWMVDNDILSKNVMKAIRPIKFETKPRLAMNQMELELVRNACETAREKAVVEFLYSTGCRASEAVSVKLSDIDFDAGTVKLFGKGKKHRTSYINAKALLAIREYLSDRGNASEYLFSKMRKPYGKVTLSCFEKWIREIISRTDGQITKRVTPHIFRHTTATQALQSGMPIEQIQRLLGHENVATTQIYAEVNQDQVQQNHARYVV